MVLQFLFGESKNVKQARSDQNAQEAKLKALQLETAEKKEKVAASLKERQRIGEIADQAHSTTAKLDCDYGELHGDMEKVRKSIEACKKDILQLTEAIDANRVASVTVRDRCTTMQEQLEIMRTIRVWTAGDASAAPSCVKATQPVSLVAADPSKSERLTPDTRLAVAVTAGLLGEALSQNLDDSCGGSELLGEAVNQNLDDPCGGVLDGPHGSKVAEPCDEPEPSPEDADATALRSPFTLPLTAQASEAYAMLAREQETLELAIAATAAKTVEFDREHEEIDKQRRETQNSLEALKKEHSELREVTDATKEKIRLARGEVAQLELEQITFKERVREASFAHSKISNEGDDVSTWAAATAFRAVELRGTAVKELQVAKEVVARQNLARQRAILEYESRQSDLVNIASAHSERLAKGEIAVANDWSKGLSGLAGGDWSLSELGLEKKSQACSYPGE
eukprot:gnl/TRDRNA2_/TRDRNA2_163523_c1_seq3.p1 gnl/TRDRNA2_/TRDRNA2_163523_c1~~gnl/TRDRNA2_/TRDRNA2_163523_c1_seq3.p1  ORF type:complete len:455 (+),score=116.91 gnl/TRDRNA2_/TRDRNA2_163523_c1_seq3:103-1467(+)